MQPGFDQIDIPVIDLGPLLDGGDSDKVSKCKNEIAKAASEWGFFQAVNHGISNHVLEAMRSAQLELFNKPLEERKACVDVVNGGSYRQGSSKAISLGQLSLTEAFHIPISHILTCERSTKHNCFRSMEQYTREVGVVGRKLIKALADELEQEWTYLVENCNPGTSFLRLNKYPPSPTASDTTYGLLPHTDTDFLTILLQDHVGGLQVLKDDKWISVKPHHDSLVVNIGDLLQACSNDVYKSVIHRVLTNQKVERYSTAFFMCPMRETCIVSESNQQPRIYRTFSYGEYRDQVDKDSQMLGTKVGLSRFLAS